MLYGFYIFNWFQHYPKYTKSRMPFDSVLTPLFSLHIYLILKPLSNFLLPTSFAHITLLSYLISLLYLFSSYRAHVQIQVR